MVDSQVLYAVLTVLAAVYVVRWRTNPLNSVPTVGGPSAPILSYLAALNFLRNGRELLVQGYRKYHGSAFKVALLDQWMIVLNGNTMVDEVRGRPDDELSFIEGAEELIQSRFTLTFGRDIFDDPYQIDIIKEKLSRTLTVVLPDIIDELTLAFPKYITNAGDECTTVNVLETMQKIVARASNRTFVGEPMCRSEPYLDLAIKFTIDIIKDGTIINCFPVFLKPYLGFLASSVKETVRRTVPYLKPLLDERRAMMANHEDDADGKPNDMLQWILEEAMLRGNSSDEAIVERIHVVNFAAIHTTSNTVTHALFDLAAAPEYIQPLRDEIEPIIAAEGWSKAALGKMWKLDSFLKESSRLHGIHLTTLTRKALKDVTLSDGTILPRGALVGVASYPAHHDEANYGGADGFDPFRFSHMREADGEGTKHQFVKTSPECITFGYGKHACPGRFFAANELKAMLAYMVLTYDMKIPGNGKRPEDICIAGNIIPNPKGQIVFRTRQVTAEVRP